LIARGVTAIRFMVKLGDTMAIRVTGLCPRLQVYDMATSVAFYEGKVGFTLVQRSQPGEEHFDWCLLELDGAQIMLSTAYPQAERPPEPDAARTAHHADIALYFGCPDVESTFDQLRAKGIKLAPPRLLPHGLKEVTVTDPDGFVLHFHWQA
jgi:glyoxylase I family protein